MRWLIALVAVLAASAAAATPPWHQSVSENAKVAAQRALEEGNTLFRHQLFGPALNRYEAALGHWDHPQLHLMRGRVLLLLSRHVEALTALWEARRHGGGGLDKESAVLGAHYELLIVASAVTLLVVDNDRPGPVGTSGGVLMAGRGRWTGFVEAGATTLEVDGHGLVQLELRPGRRVHVVIPSVGAPRIEERALLGEDVERYTETLARPPRPVDPSRLPEPIFATPPSIQVEDLLLPFAPSGDVAVACEHAKARLRARCEVHEREVRVTLERIRIIGKTVTFAAKRYAELLRGGLVEGLH